MAEYLDLAELREQTPGNESEEHFILKQVARYWLYSLGCRVIATEIQDMWSGEDDKIEKSKKIELKGEWVRRVKNMKCPYCNSGLFDLDATEDKLLMCESCSRIARLIKGVWYRYRQNIRSRPKVIDALGIKSMSEYSYEDREWTKKYRMKGIEVKASMEDFKNGFCTMPDHAYILAPKGVIPKEKIPKYVGFLEADFDRLEIQLQPVLHIRGVETVKRPTENIDVRFKDFEAHQCFAGALIGSICRALTIESLFKNGLGR